MRERGRMERERERKKEKGIKIDRNGERERERERECLPRFSLMTNCSPHGIFPFRCALMKSRLPHKGTAGVSALQSRLTGPRTEDGEAEPNRRCRRHEEFHCRQLKEMILKSWHLLICSV